MYSIAYFPEHGMQYDQDQAFSRLGFSFASGHFQHYANLCCVVWLVNVLSQNVKSVFKKGNFSSKGDVCHLHIYSKDSIQTD